MQNDEILIKIEDLKYAYEAEEGEEQRYALDGISLDIKKGEFLASVFKAHFRSDKTNVR